MTHPPDDAAGSHAGGSAETAQSRPVSIAEIVERRVALTWPEAVALITEVCRLVVEAAPTATQVPESARLLVFADGSVRIGPWRGEMDIAGAARTLHELLAGGQPPTPLRLFIGHAISSEKFSTVSEFGGALAYYERPGRTELIQSAFQRFLLTPVEDLVSERPTVPPPEVQEEPKMKEAAQRAKASARSLAAVVFLLVFAGGVLVALRVLSARPDTGGTPTLESVSAQATSEFAELKGTLRDMGLPVGAETPALPAPAQASVPEPQRAAPRPATARRAVVRVPSTTNRPVAARAVAPGPSVAEVPAPVPAVQAPAPPAPAPDPEEEDSVYNNQSVGVSPPVVLDRRVLPSTLSLSGPQAQNRMELIIGVDGRVEQVRMLSELERMPDMMLLSGAKTWLFKPAMKDGRPVRYRLPVTWAVSPR